VSGEVFLETLGSFKDTSKFRVTGGEIFVGENIYDIVFGKARVSSSGPSGENNSLIVIGQVMDFEGNGNTLRLSLDLEKIIEGDLSEPIELDVLSKSKISREWSVMASGSLSVL